MIKIVPANAKALKDYYGDAKLPTMHAFMMYDDDKALAVAGFVRIPNGFRFMFSEFKEGMLELYKDKYRYTFLKTAKKLIKLADEKHWTLIATADPEIPTAPQFLTHLGFVPDDDWEYIRWHG